MRRKINKDLLNILIYFFFLIILALMINVMFADVREYGYVNINTIDILGSDLKEIWYGILAISFGTFFGANIIVVFFDKKKRLQGILISVSSLFVLGAYIHVIILRLLIFISGLLIGAFLCYNDGKKSTKRDKRYSRATKVVAFLAIYAISLSLANLFASIILSGTAKMSDTIIYSLLTIAFILIFNKFINYPIAESKVFVIAPKNAGKTVFMCGCYQWTKDHEKSLGFASSHLNRSLSYLYNGNWPPGTGDKYEKYTFKYEHGTLFVKDIDVVTFDFGGEYLEKIDDITNYIDRKSSDDKITPSSLAEKIGDGIYYAEKLIFLIDARNIGTKLIADPILEYYSRILEKEKILDKPYYIIITKSDIFYKREWPLTEEYYDKFRDTVIQELEEKEPFFDQLKQNAEDVIPVFFEETNGLPKIVENKFVTVGFGRTLEAMAE